jgi:uncharacterized protein (TIGR03066 family)
MNALRLMVLVAVAAALTAGVRAEDKKDNAKLIVGTWEVTKSFDMGPTVGATIEFTKEGKVTVKAKVDGKDVNYGGTYKVDGDKLALALKRGDMERKLTISIKKLSDKELVTENEDKKSVSMKRKK